MSPLPTARCRCPRCGYDLRGETERWGDACPVDGTCTECGLTFRYGDLLGDGEAPQWSIERRNSLRSLWRRMLATAWRAMLRPARFWREMRMHHVIAWGRLPLVAVTWMVLGWCGIAIFTALAVLIQLAGSVGWGEPAPWANAAVALAMPLDGGTLVNAVMASWSRWGALPPQPVGGPLALCGLFVAVAGACVMSASAATFLALPISRRTYKVRMAHVWRVAAYGALPWLVAALVPGFFPLFHAWMNPGAPFFGLYSGRDIQPLLYAIYFVAPVLSAWWWRCATTHYLRMPHGFAVGATVTIVGVLATGLIGALIAIGQMTGFR